MYDDDMEGGGLTERLKEKAKSKAKKAAWGWLKKILIAILPFLGFVFIVVMIATGFTSALSMAGAFFSGMFGEDADATNVYENMDEINNLTDEEILKLIEEDKLPESFYDLMMINREELKFLIEEVMECNEVPNDIIITVQCFHEYREEVIIPVAPAVTGIPGAGGEPIAPTTPEPTPIVTTEPVKKYEPKTFTIRPSDTEWFKLDWRLVYALCLTDMMNGTENWEENLSGEGGSVVHYGPDHEKIRQIIDAMKMNYDYLKEFSGNDYFTYAESQNMVHEFIQYGDPEEVGEENGRWTCYIPQPVLENNPNSNHSGYSYMYYDVSGSTINGLVEVSDMEMFEELAKEYCPNYDFDYFVTLLGLVPGGDKLAENFKLYEKHQDTGVEIKSRELLYSLGGTSSDSIPTGERVGIIQDGYGDLEIPDFGDVPADGEIGALIVSCASRYIGNNYDMGLRDQPGYKDCSSLVWYTMKDVWAKRGCADYVNPDRLFPLGNTAAAECEGLYNNGLLPIAESDLRPGDLVFYSSEYNGRFWNITHVGIYAGKKDGVDMMIHASYGRDMVVYANMYRSDLKCFGRPYFVE